MANTSHILYLLVRGISHPTDIVFIVKSSNDESNHDKCSGPKDDEKGDQAIVHHSDGTQRLVLAGKI